MSRLPIGTPRAMRTEYREWDNPYDEPDEPEPDRDAQRRRELEDGRDRFETREEAQFETNQ